MIIILTGASGTGKDSVAKVLREKYGFKTVISWTTRQPREGEIDGLNYHFVTLEEFKRMQEHGEFIEYDTYSGERYYGSKISDYKTDDNIVTILTPNGVRQFLNNLDKANIDKKDIKVVYLKSPLSEKCKRYISREEKSFNIDMLMELMRRSIADEEMFRGMEDIADITVLNDKHDNIEGIAYYICVRSIE